MPLGAFKATVLGAAGSGGAGEGGTFEWIAGYTVEDADTVNSVAFDTTDASDYQEWFVRWSFAGSNPTDINLRVNADTNSYYYSNGWWTYNSNSGKNGLSNHDQLRLVWTGGTSSSYAAPVAGVINWSGANESNKHSVGALTYRSYDTYSTYGTFDFEATLRAVSEHTVSSFTIFAQTSANYFDVGDTIQLFGAKKTSD